MSEQTVPPATSTKRQLRLAYAGDDSFATCLLALVERSDVDLAFCLTAEDARYTSTVEDLARGAGAKIFHGPPERGGWHQLADADVDFLITAAYGHRVPVEQLQIDTMINVHPSYLPHGRGPNPLVHIAGSADATETAGVTIHLLDETFDTGPVLIQRRFEGSTKNPSLQDLTLWAMAVAPAMLNELLDDLDGHVTNARQQEGGSYWPGPTTDEATIDLASATNAEISATLNRFARQGLVVRLADGHQLTVASGHLTAATHGFSPGRLLGRLRGDFILSAPGGLLRAIPFSDEVE